MKDIFDLMSSGEFEQIDFAYDPKTGLKCIVVIHNTVLGPALGGTRMMEYPTMEEALKDAASLAESMTYKNAAAGINFGGGKAVIIGDAENDKDEALLRAFGRQLQSFGGRFITGVDIGTNPDDMVIVHQETDYNVALPESYGGPDSTSKGTAYGVFCSMKALAEETFSNPNLEDKTIAVQGTGSVGVFLIEYLTNEGCEVIVTDVDEKRVEKIKERFGVKSVAPDEIYSLDVDIFAPCAVGDILNDETIPQLKCKIVAGSANNQLKDEKEHCKMLQEKGIVYGVDYILSAGGVINNANCFIGYNRKRAYKHIEKIADNIKNVLNISQNQDKLMVEAAMDFANKRLKTAQDLKKWDLPSEKKIKM